MNPVLLYMTCPSAEVAEDIGRALLESRLVACTKILPPQLSQYWWDGEIQSATEVSMVCDTREDLFPQIEALVLEKHPYECPCIITIPIEQGYQPFLNWIGTETSKAVSPETL